ncbi:type II secretion system F family protein [Echinimonas agarilytica]|uniref:Type II secretion system F family protein n=1 Tax=Echinimonas agarilytica TaxID=1215918 RepID=A0AA41W502_9GAMM|nr:type II secretion system F family protein [Echinimonas agarilytica]MCM2678794.1 type II secretion system F family protein [Echinimonas agarilytica]
MVKTPAKKGPQLNTFEWTGINRKGKRVSGETVGANEQAVKGQLRKQAIAVSKIKKKASPLFSFGGGIKAMDICMVTRQIATMLGAGVPLVQALEIIGKGSEKPAVRVLLEEIHGEVSAGNPLSDTLRKHPRHFDDLYCDLVASGEQSGALDAIYDRVATYKEKAEALKAKIKKAMMYPSIVVAVAIAVTAILLVFVVPSFEEIFSNFGAELPAFTLFVIGLSNWLTNNILLVVIAIAAFAFAFRHAHRSSLKVRDNTDKAILKLPVVGNILNQAAVARYTRTLSTTFAAGVPLIDALDSAAGASGNAVYRDAIRSVKSDVSSGIQLNSAMRQSDMFPDMVNQMVMIGEESGSLDDMLAKVAGIYEQQVDDAVDNLSALLEPLIMVVIGILVGGLIVSMYLPIFQLGQVVG